MIYADEAIYQEYLLGRKRMIPVNDFSFWSNRAGQFIDTYTFNRITDSEFVIWKTEIGMCACELAEFLYQNDGNENLKSESIAGRSASYEKGYEYQICQKHLLMTGMMVRGQNYAAETNS